MKPDALGRRARTAPPNRRVGRLILTDADYALFEAIDRHGPLPTPYLYEFNRHLRRDYTHLQNRLTEFYNGDVGGSYLTRPPQQFAAYEARYQHLVYDLTHRARTLVAERGTLTRAARRTDPFVHRLMCACVSASFELAASGHRLRYIGLSEILGRPAAMTAREAVNPLALPTGLSGQPTVVPDMVFGLEYPGAGFRFFAVECDRNTESIERRNLRQSAFGRKLLAYGAALDAETYRTWWGIPNLHILTVTTSALHAHNILSAVVRHVERHHQHAFAVSVDTTFGANWRVPSAPLSSMLSSAWDGVGAKRNFASA